MGGNRQQDQDEERESRIQELIEQHRHEVEDVQERAEARMQRARTTIRQAKAAIESVRARLAKKKGA